MVCAIAATVRHMEEHDYGRKLNIRKDYDYCCTRVWNGMLDEKSRDEVITVG